MSFILSKAMRRSASSQSRKEVSVVGNLIHDQ